MTRKISQHGMVGDARSAALIAGDGTIDWLCWPRFDSPSLFAALLDTDKAGSWRLAPVGACHSMQRYVDDTNVLETVFERPDARIVIMDAMPVSTDQHRRSQLDPEHELQRIVRCEAGEVEMELRLRFAPNYGQSKARVVDRGRMGIHAYTGQAALTLRAEVPLHVMPDGEIVGRFVIREGEKVRFALTYSSDAPGVLPLLGEHADEAMERTIEWWSSWSAHATYDGPYRNEVVRSALTLKLLSYAPSGAMLAAATTSLPERLGGALNWDYRYCWLRDAAFMSRASIGLGYVEEAASFIHWLMHFTSLRQPRLHVLYDVYGEKPRRERLLPHLRGYADSRPVRIGNAAESQLQLDLYGEVIDAVSTWVEVGGELDLDTRRELNDLGRYVCRNWWVPDQGIWEPRGCPEHHTHSRVLCWTALDRLLMIHRKMPIPRLDVDAVLRERDRIRQDIEGCAWSSRLQSYVGRLHGEELDAAVLLMPWYGFEKASSPRMIATVRRTLQHLDAGDGLLYRNDGLRNDGDGGFIACGFWAAEALADGAGSLNEARMRFEQLVRQMNPVGLLSEEVESHGRELIGNFPQAFSHVGLISVALALEERAGHRKRVQPQAISGAMEVHR
ncbi:MAG: glycoside hydrolase family 15 protein [Myxococcaceae bacterium]